MRINDHTFNRLAVLKAIRRSGPVSRIELPSLTGLSGGTITQLTSDLMRRGLIVERKEHSKRPGRPRTYLEINAGGAIVVGASFTGAGTLTTAFVDLLGKRVFAKDIALKAPRSLRNLAAAVADALHRAIEDFPFDRSRISRIGIAVPAIVDSLHGVIHYMATLPAKPFPFSEIVGNWLHLPVTVENDMVCMARAEHWFGNARTLDTFTLVHVGYSIGTAKYADGLPKAGANGFNQELGHTKTAFGRNAPLCFCGGRGCIAAYCSVYGIVKHSGLLRGSALPPLASLDSKFSRLLSKAESGDKKALELFHVAGFHLGLAIANHLNADDPGYVLILMSDRRFRDLIVESFYPALEENTLPGILPNTRITFDIANNDWRWKGTAALALEKTYLGSG